MAIIDLARPVRVEVGLPAVPGVKIELFLRLPSWEERAAMLRAVSEQRMKLQFIYDKFSKGGNEDALKNATHEEQQAFMKELGAAEAEFEDATTVDCLNFLQGFKDKQGDEVLFSHRGKDVLSSDPPETWKPVIQSFLGSALSKVWKQLLDKSGPSETSVEFSSNLIKN